MKSATNPPVLLVLAPCWAKVNVVPVGVEAMVMAVALNEGSATPYTVTTLPVAKP
jgi:hypothetical protein